MQMRISELKKAMDFVVTHISKTNIQQYFMQLINVMEANARTRVPQQRLQPISDQKKILLDQVKKVDIEKFLTFNERKLLAIYVDLDIFGIKGAVKIEDIFTQRQLDQQGAIDDLRKLEQKYSKLIGDAQNVLNILQPFAIPTLETDVPDGFGVLQITFKGAAAIENLDDLREYTDEWWKIVRGFGRLVDCTPGEVKVASFEKGSVIAEFFANFPLLEAIGLSGKLFLSGLATFLVFKRQLLEVENSQVATEATKQQMRDDAQQYKDKLIEEVTQKVLEKYSDKPEDAKGEARLSVRLSSEFLEKGGTIDFRLKASDLEKGEHKELAESYDRVRALETDIEAQRKLGNGDK
jgi:hypothetical protein